MGNKGKNIAKVKIICGLALACLVAFFGVIALINPFKTSATDDLKPLYELSANSLEDFASKWNQAINNNETNTKITLTNNIDADNGSFGTGVGFTTAGSVYVPNGYNLEIDLNGYRLNKGGIIKNDGSVIINDGTLIISDSNTSNQTHYFEIKGTTYEIKGGTIMGGNTMTNGGGIYNNGTLNFKSGNIACNYAVNGGAIATAANSTTNITGGNFSYNFAENFTDDENNGGAIALLGAGATLNVENGNFMYNQANTNGGAIYAPAGSNLNIENITLNNNSANFGGGIATATEGTIEAGIFTANKATLSGGAICVLGGELDINQGVFENNSAQQDTANGEGAGGGAIAVLNGTLNINGVRKNTNTSNITFTGNTARFGGAISNNGGTVNAAGIVVAHNTATHKSVDAYGGGIASLAGASTYTDSYFTENSVKTGGKVSYTAGGTLTYDGGIIEKVTGETQGNINYTTGDSTINFMGGVTIQYNTGNNLFSGEGKVTYNFNDANIQYNGYASASDFANNESAWTEVLFESSFHSQVTYNFTKVNAHHNETSNENYSIANGVVNIGTPDGSDEDVVFTNYGNEDLGVFNFYGIDSNIVNVYHVTCKNCTSFIFGWGTASINIYGGVFAENQNTCEYFITGYNVHVYGGIFENSSVGRLLQGHNVNITGGVVNNITATEDYLVNADNLTITDGTFTNNKSWFQMIYARTVTITGGTFTDNLSKYAFTAYLDNDYESGLVSEAGSINIGGAPIIKNNKAGTNKINCNINTNGHRLNIISKLTGQQGNICGTFSGCFTMNYSVYNPSSTTPPRSYFVSDYDNYKIEKVDGEAVAIPQAGSASDYTAVPAALAAPEYNGKAQNIISGYASAKMQVVSIKYTQYTETSINTKDTANAVTITDANEIAKYISGNKIIATNAGEYAVTFRVKSGTWLTNDGATTNDDQTVTATISKYRASYDTQYVTYNYTGTVQDAIVNWKPAISSEESLWLKDWTLRQSSLDNLYGCTFGQDARTYYLYYDPVLQPGMARNYYVGSKYYRLTINAVDVADDANIDVRVADAVFTGNPVQPDFEVFYRGVSLGSWTNGAWVENNDRPFGPFKIKDVSYANNINPTDQPVVFFTVDTDYLQTSSYKVMNFQGSKGVYFTIYGHDVTTDYQLNGAPIVTTSKVYDGTRDVQVQWRGLVTLEGAAFELADVVATYDDANAGDNKTITVRYIFSGDGAWAYSYSYTITDCEITQAVITAITGLTANKTYDGTVQATVVTTGADYVGKVASDEFSVEITGVTYVNANAGKNKQMNLDSAVVTLVGAPNYKLAENVELVINGTINTATLTATATGATGVFDGEPHAAITPGEVNLCEGATEDDEASIKWEYSLDGNIWDEAIPQMTKGANITVYYRVSANNHTTYNGEVRFALSPVDIADATVTLGQTTVTYDGKEHNLKPRITAEVSGKVIELTFGEDYDIEYINSYTGGEYENGKGDTKNVGTVTLVITGSGSSFVGTAAAVSFTITPQVVALPAEDTTSYHYDGTEQTYQVAADERYTVEGNVQKESGEHDVTITLNDKHNTIWANDETDDLVYKFIIYQASIDHVDWSSWSQDYFYVGQSYTAAEMLSGTPTAQTDAGAVVEGTVSFVDYADKLTIEDLGRAHFNTPNESYIIEVKFKFTPNAAEFGPVIATLQVPAKWILVTYDNGLGGSAQTAYNYGEAVTYFDKMSGESKLTREYYTHVGWTLNPENTVFSARGLNESQLNVLLAGNDVVPLNGETLATQDATYYAVWCYVDYTIRFYTNNPKQGEIFSDDTVTVAMVWKEESKKVFTDTYGGAITEANGAYVYTYNIAEWQRKISFNNITWNDAAGFKFRRWLNDRGVSVNSLTGNPQNIDLYAQWEGKEFSVNYVDVKGGVINGTGRVVNGQVLTQAPTLKRDGLNFSGWFLNEDDALYPDNIGPVVLGETIIWTTEDITLYAGWTEKQVTVSIIQNAGLTVEVTEINETGVDRALLNGQWVTVGTKLKIKVTEQPGYQFTDLTVTAFSGSETYATIGYDSTEFEYTVGNYDGAASYTLKFEGHYTVITYNITYPIETEWSFVDKDFPNPYSFTVEQIVTLPTDKDVKRTGYTLGGWYLKGDDGNYTILIQNTQNYAQNLTVYPKWNALDRNITLYKAGKQYRNVVYKTAEEYTLPDLSQDAGFVGADYLSFKGWSTNKDLSGKILAPGSTYIVQPENNNLYAVLELKSGSLTVTADKNFDTYNFGETVLTLSTQYSYAYQNKNNEIKLSYTFYRKDNGQAIPSTDGKLRLSQCKDSGEYYCEITVSAESYALPVVVESESITVNIYPLAITGAQWDTIPNQIYTGNALTPDLPTIMLSEHELVANRDFNYAYSENTNEGWAHIAVTGKDNFSGNLDITFKIDPATMTATVTGYTGIYDGQAHDGIKTKSASVEGTTWTYSREEGTYTADMPTFTSAGSYTVYYRVTCPNYQDVYGSVSVEISKKEVTVNWPKLVWTYDGEEHEPEPTVETGVTGETLTLTVESDKPTNAGTYEARASMNNKNYTLLNATVEFTIDPKEITVNINVPASQRFGELTASDYVTASLNNLVGTDDPKIFITYTSEETGEVVVDNDGKPTEEGRYLVEITIKDPNYKIIGLNQAYFLIRPENGTFENKITVQMPNWTYGNTPSVLDFSAIDGKDTAIITYYRVNGDDREKITADEITYKLSAGKYVVHVLIPALEIEENGSYGYTEAEEECEFQVLPRELTLTWTGAEYEYDGTKHTPEVALGNIVDDDAVAVTVVTKSDDGIAAKTYTATVSTPNNANYKLPAVISHEYKVTPRKITVTIVDLESEYGDALEELVANITKSDNSGERPICGLDNQDGSVYTLTKEPGNNAGKYTITGTSTNPNYDVTIVDGHYTITRQAATVAWELAEVYTYAGAEQNVRAYIIDEYSGEEIDLIVTAYHDDQVTTFRNAGTYRLVASETSGNYALSTDIQENVVMEQAILTITPDDLTVRYSEAFTLTATMQGFVGEDDASVLIGGQLSTPYQLNGDINEQSEYPITATGYANDNYRIEYGEGTLTILGIYLEVQINDQTSVYGESTLNPEYVFLGEPIMNPSLVFTIEKEAGDEVGTYKLTGKILNRNYGVVFVSAVAGRDYGLYTITKRQITVEILDESSVYGSEFAELEARVALDAVVGEDNEDGSVYTLTKEPGNTVGEYRITGISTNPNYTVTFKSRNDAGRAYGLYRITPKQITKPQEDRNIYYYTGKEIRYNDSGWMDREYYTLSGDALNNANAPIQRNAGTYTIYLTLDPNCVWKNAAVGEEQAVLAYKFVINKATFTESVEYTAYNQNKVYDGAEHDALMIKSPVNRTQYTWEFSTDRKTYTTDIPKYKKPVTQTVYFKITSQNYEDYLGSFQVQILKATLTVIVEENTVEKGKKPALNAFTVTGLADSDARENVIELTYPNTAYNAGSATVGDTFDLTAKLRDEYKDCYEIVLVKPNKLVVVEAKTNMGLIIGIVAAAVVVVGGGAVAAIVIAKKKKGKGKKGKGKVASAA